jgi:hypothetical protein
LVKDIQFQLERRNKITAWTFADLAVLGDTFYCRHSTTLP